MIADYVYLLAYLNPLMWVGHILDNSARFLILFGLKLRKPAIVLHRKKGEEELKVRRAK